MLKEPEKKKKESEQKKEKITREKMGEIALCLTVYYHSREGFYTDYGEETKKIAKAIGISYSELIRYMETLANVCPPAPPIDSDLREEWVPYDPSYPIRLDTK